MISQVSMEQARKKIASSEIATADEVFDLFCNATTLKSILGHFRHLCDLLKMRPNVFPQFYPKFKSKLRSWKAQALWKKFDQRANHKCYNRGKACPNSRVLIIGGGPCGLRSAIEAQLLGAKVVVVEKRDRASRNNVLHLWPFVIQDLRALGAKKFFGKFCAGSIDHISIRQLQCILLKVSLILGVEFHENVSFESLLPPPENQEEGKIGWRAKTTPPDHPVSQYEFDVLIGADGKRNTLEGFKRKEFRGKLAIAITANFINKRTEAEARVEEISGVAFIFNQKFFKELYQETGIDLENIVYYKDDTHYFVMTAKKHSLIDKGVILQDHADTAKLLAKENVNRDALMLYAREAAEFSTEYQMMDMEFAVNHYGQPDVAMFDFTSMYAAENASRVLERNGHRLFMTLVGDSLLEPFWPTGSGCARGFLSSMDAGWAIKGWSASMLPLEVLAERESIYRLLGQTTPENLNRDYAAYTLDPHTRYPNLNSRSVSAIQVRSLLDTDDPENIKQPSALPSTIDLPKKRRRRDTQVHPDTLLHWLQRQVALYDNVHIVDMGASFKDGLAISAIIHRYRPDLIDFSSLTSDDLEKTNQQAFDILEKELGISPVMTGEEMAHCDVPDKLAMFSYLTQIYEAFRGEIPHIKHPKLEPENDERPLYTKQLSQLTHEQKAQLMVRLAKPEIASRARHSRARHNNENAQATTEKKSDAVSRRSRKRRSTEKMGATVEERQKRLGDIEKNRVDRMRKRQYLRIMATQQFIKSIQMLAANAKRERDEPFEDYSIFLYRQTAPDFKDRVKELEQKILYPDRESKLHAGHHRGSMDDEFSGRIKDIEDKLRGTAATEKKPKDLLRAIGKIEKTDWNVKEIEKKIEENKMGRGTRQERVEKVPKWSREQFLARQIKMEKKGRDPNKQDSKYADIDNTLKDIEKKKKDGNVLGHNKVSAMAEQFANKSQDNEPKVQRSNSKAAITLPTQGGSELCHFCDKRVYLMERMSAEGKYFHRGCFRCEYCSTTLRIGNHTFDRDKNGGRFYCAQHFGLSGTIKARVEDKKLPSLNKENIPESSLPKKHGLDKAKTPLEGVAGLDLLDRGQTPERIEFENLARFTDAEEAHSQMDEDEWTDRNFGASAAEMGSSDEISDMSDSDEENEVYEEAMDQPLTTEGTIELAKNWTLRYSHPQESTGHSDTGSNEYEDSSDEYTSEDEESDTATEDEEDVRARELRKQEVWLKVPPRSSDTDTGSETEVASDNDTSEDSQENSATEISTDSEFEHDGATPTQHEIPEITINDGRARRNRGQAIEPKKVQIKSRVISSINVNAKQTNDASLKPRLTKLEATKEEATKQSRMEKINDVPSRTSNVPCPVVPLANPRKGDYSLNRTHSTGGIASKMSLELKKRYLLGGPMIAGNVVKSGSTSNVDTRLRNLSDAITQHQKLLNPASEPSPTMQAFLQRTGNLDAYNRRLSPISPTGIFTASATIKQFPAREISPNLRTTADAGIVNEAAEKATKIQLPDLIKETNIIESMKETSQAAIVAGSSNEPVTMDNNPSEASIITSCEINNEDERIVAEENDVCRPRSPLHETSIVVPRVDWNKNLSDAAETRSSDDSVIDSDSLSSSENDDFGAEFSKEKASNISTPPRLRINSVDGDLLLLDAANDRDEKNDDAETNFEPDSIEFIDLRDDDESATKIDEISGTNIIATGVIEAVNNNLTNLRISETLNSMSNCSSPTSSASIRHDDSMENDVTTAALTETEFSEWARDVEATVGDDLRNVEHDINPEFITFRKQRGKYEKKLSADSLVREARIAKEEDLTDNEIDAFGFDRSIVPPSNDTSKLLVNGENIDYMDTDNESILDDSLRDATNVALLKNRGYVEFVNIGITSGTTRPEIMRPLIDAPMARAEMVNEYCTDDEQRFDDANIIEIDPVTLDDVRDRLNGSAAVKTANFELSSGATINDDEACARDEALDREICQSMDEDSLLIVEPAEDTTTSELITILASPVNPQTCLATPVSTNAVAIAQNANIARNANDIDNPDYLEYVKRLQSRIAEFGNVKDSIDIRKSKRRNSKNSMQQKSSTEIIAEEIKSQQEITCSGEGYNSPATSRKLEEITRERTKQKTLIQDLLMDKMEAHKQKSAEKKARRAARTSSFASPSPSTMTTTTTMFANVPSPVPCSTTPNSFVPASIISSSKSPIRASFAEADATTLRETPISFLPRVINDSSLSSSSCRSQSRERFDTDMTSVPSSRSLSATSRENSYNDIFKTPVAPPRLKHEEARRTAEKAKLEARERARLKSDEDLGLSPEDRIRELRMKVARRQLSMDDKRRDEDERAAPEAKTRHASFSFARATNKLQTSKSTDNVKALTRKINCEPLLPAGSAKSMDELSGAGVSGKTENDTPVVRREKKKITKDPERRKSIIKAVSDFFKKKDNAPSPPSTKDKVSMFRLSSKIKDKGKLDKVVSPAKNEARPRSVCEGMLVGNFVSENLPVVPPPPLNYDLVAPHVSDESLSDEDSKTTALSTSQMNKTTVGDGSCGSVPRKAKTAKRVARQAQLKRLRMAQEIQRKLEETEVKQRELESRGVSVEKALRGEGECSDREEADLLREWFDLMRERTELRRYEKELLVRAQEVQLEDRHERLQHELRERLADDDKKKTRADVKKEGEILTEMLEIVAKRDSLIALLEEERQRYRNEDRDLEAQMLAKGLRLTPINKSGPKYSV